MGFELLSWIYISFICLIWGNVFVHVFFRGRLNIPDYGFPLFCFLGMVMIGVATVYISLFAPLKGWLKICLQLPAFLYLLNSTNRRIILSQLKSSLVKLSYSDLMLLTACIVMVLFLSTSPIIHPDSLHYHILSIKVFNQYGMIPGIANLQLEFGFQSVWFALLGFFDFSAFQPFVSFPLSGCVLCWFIIFVISFKGTGSVRLSASESNPERLWYLLLLIFTVFSWTQIRLTAASESPDFIVTISLLLAFYFFTGMSKAGESKWSFYFAALISLFAISVKLSAVVIMLIPVYILVSALIRKRYLFCGTCILLIALFLFPVILRNVIATGYPLYPSSIAAIFHSDWKLDELKLTQFQHYITAYARFPVTKAGMEMVYSASPGSWLPLWWHHLYFSDKLLIFLIVFGVLLNLIVFRKWVRTFSKRSLWAFVFAMTGAVVWFIKAPDPRFGTGFLLPVIYFLWAPWVTENFSGKQWIFKSFTVVKLAFSLLILAYILYRSIYFFHPGQLLFPDGVKQTTPLQTDCGNDINKMLFQNSSAAEQIPDSCRTFLFRGTSVKDGFKPAE